MLTIGLGMKTTVANATNSVSLWPGSLGGAIGFKNLLPKTGHYLKTLFLPTAIGSAAGAWLFLRTTEGVFQKVVPALILFAALLLFLQPQVKKFALKGGKAVPVWAGFVIQFVVSVYGGYFGAGMGIMMLAAFGLYIEGTIHELNAVKSWLGVIINFVCSLVFVFEKLIDPWVAVVLTVGSVVGGFYGAKLSQKVDPEKMRRVIAIYGLLMAGYFAYRASA
jgi:uncharacterized membrane protein YfcA